MASVLLYPLAAHREAGSALRYPRSAKGGSGRSKSRCSSAAAPALAPPGPGADPSVMPLPPAALAAPLRALHCCAGRPGEPRLPRPFAGLLPGSAAEAAALVRGGSSGLELPRGKL